MQRYYRSVFIHPVLKILTLRSVTNFPTQTGCWRLDRGKLPENGIRFRADMYTGAT